nr:MAG TPA: protein of unknown function (DUF4969) [Caudoviricetes sp.]
MKEKWPLFGLLLSAAVLTLSGCAVSCPPHKSVSVPPLPESVVLQSQTPSTISEEVWSWRQEVLRNLQKLGKP